MNQAIAVCAALLIWGGAAAADDPLSSRVAVTLGGFWPDVDTTVQVHGDGGRIGTRLDFEGDLGLDDRDALPTVSIAWRIGRRHYLDVLYFELTRDGSHTIDRTISFENRTFEITSTLDSFFDTELVRLSYGYAFIDSERHLLLGQLGVHYTRVTAGLERRALADVRVEADTDVPLPVIGLVYDFRFTDRLRLDLRGQIFRLEFEGIDGALNNFSATLDYAFTPRWALFAGYNYYSIDVDADADDWNGAFDFTYRGPWAGLRIGFGNRP
jgi:hypothetical protein